MRAQFRVFVSLDLMCEKDIAQIGWNGYFWIMEKMGLNSLSMFRNFPFSSTILAKVLNRLPRYLLTYVTCKYILRRKIKIDVQTMDIKS